MDFEARARELVSKMTLEEKISQMCNDSPAIERLNIPAYNWWNEALHGVARSGKATVFPQAIAMAASFDEKLVYKIASAISDEARAKFNAYRRFGGTDIYQGLTLWSPNINIFRDPRWGRGHETYGEDPLLTGRLGTAFIKGIQGKGRHRKADATLKHFAVHSGPESSRHTIDVNVSEKDLYQTFLFAFEYCIRRAKPSAVMGAYNRLFGEPCCGSKFLLKEILRDKYGFDGYVVSDCGAVSDFHDNHKVTKTSEESAALAVNCGCDLNCGDTYTHLIKAVERGLVSEETITECVIRLFAARFRLGMFDEDCEYDNIPFDVIECEKHRKLNLKMARESIVLLKNDGILPLKKGKTIAVIGPNADSKCVLLGNYHGTPTEYKTILQAFLEYNDGKVNYAQGCDICRPDDDIPSWSEKYLREGIIAAKNSDVVVMVMGLNPYLEGEEGNVDGVYAPYGYFSGDKPDVELPPSQKILYEEILKTGKPIIFVNGSGSCINLLRQKETANAIVQLFYPGAMGPAALCDIIYGKVSPSGRLPVTFYGGVEDLPDFEDYSMENRTYKFYKGEPVYEFGYGLTYCDISENWIDLNTVELVNDGEYDVYYTVLKFEHIPHKSLADFKKVNLKKKSRVTVRFK